MNHRLIALPGFPWHMNALFWLLGRHAGIFVILTRTVFCICLIFNLSDDDKCANQ